MEKIEIDNFKAFGSRIALIPTNAHLNLLIYGENGSGKSSIYEALKLVFYHTKMYQNVKKIGVSQDESKNDEENFYKDFLHRQNPSTPNPKVDYTIRFNNTPFKLFDITDYQCYMVSNFDLRYITYETNGAFIKERDVINLLSILSRLYFHQFDIEIFLKDHIDELIEKVNNSLNCDFYEDFIIGKENSNFDIYISDPNNHLRESDGIRTVFNEAKINLIIILIYFNAILILKTAKTEKHKLLVIDDVITSLDASNRMFFIDFILKYFSDFQKIVFTHNIGFNNLSWSRIQEYGKKDEWKTYNLYLTNTGPQLYDYNELSNAAKIKDEFSRGFLLPNQIGNEIRKRFEAVIFELAKAIQIGTAQEPRLYIQRLIEEQKPLYFKKSGGKLHTADDLVKEVDSILAGIETNATKISNAKTAISKYQTDTDMQKIIPVIKEFKYYQKLVIHQLSHGTTSMPSFNQKEVESSMVLLERLEECVKSIKDGLGVM